MSLSCDDYQIQNIYRYNRKSYKKSRRGMHDSDICNTKQDTNIEIADISPRSDTRNDDFSVDSPGCSCDLHPTADIANILHRKHPIITLAQQQLQRILEETDKLLCDNTRCCKSVYDFLCICKDVVLNQNKWQCVLMALIAVSFILGLLLGAASCGSYLGHFNSPLLTCIDNYFIPNSYPSIEETFRSIV